MPGTELEIAPNSPRTTAGANGLGSQVECWGGPPNRNNTMQRLALGKVFAGEAAAGEIPGQPADNPSALIPPACSKARREMPSHSRGE